MGTCELCKKQLGIKTQPQSLLVDWEAALNLKQNDSQASVTVREAGVRKAKFWWMIKRRLDQKWAPMGSKPNDGLMDCGGPHIVLLVHYQNGLGAKACMDRMGLPRSKHYRALKLLKDLGVFEKNRPSPFHSNESRGGWAWRASELESETVYWRKADRWMDPAFGLSQMDRYYLDHERSKKRMADYARQRYSVIGKTGAHKIKQFARNQIARIKRNALTFKKCRRSIEYLGCTNAQAVKWIESQLKDGWTWQNHGTTWHIDHIIQLSDGDLNDDEHLRRICHYTNLRPLSAHENLSRPRGEYAKRNAA